MNRLAMPVRLAVCLAALLSTALQAAQVKTLPSDAEPGHSLFQKKGCYECHGYAAQGALGVAPPLDPLALDAEAFVRYIRKPPGEMPPYSRTLLSPAEADEIFVYLKSLPPPPNPSAIQALRSYVAQTSNNVPPTTARSPSDLAVGAQHGRELYQQYCATCHGVHMEGGIAPSLIHEGRRRTAAEIATLLQMPPNGMPKLVPNPVSETDAQALAVFVSAGESTGHRAQTKPR